ncbi:MAG: hypothetical protein ACWA44_08545 [Thiotrichales bacterium]
MASQKPRDMPLKEFRSLVNRLASVKLAKSPQKPPTNSALLDHGLNPGAVKTLPPEQEASKQKRAEQNRSLLHEWGGESIATAYSQALSPQLDTTSKALLEELKSLQNNLQTSPVDSLEAAQQALTALNHNFSLALKISREYLELLKARKQVNEKAESLIPADIKRLLSMTDRKLKRRLRLRRAILEQFYAQRLLLIAWNMQQIRPSIEAHFEKRQRLGTRLTSLRLDIGEIERKWSKTPGNPLLTSRLSELRAAIDRTGNEIRSLQPPILEQHIEEWLSGVVDYRLLREKNERLRRLNKRSLKSVAQLIRTFFELQNVKMQQEHEAKTMRVLEPTNYVNSKEASTRFALEYLEKREAIRETPYWIPEVVRAKKLKKFKGDLLSHIRSVNEIP